MTTPQLKPQEPGVNPSVDSSKLEDLAAGNVGDFVEALDYLTDDELNQLAAIEAQDKARTTAIGAIKREQQRRIVAIESPADDEPAAHEPIGDAASYAKMHARDIDQSKIVRPVLTLEGWLLPVPSAVPQV